MRTNAIECDEVLFGHLRRLRLELARERDVPSYIIFSDVTLRQMARFYPLTAEEFHRISGVGEMKLAEFCEPFTAEIKKYLETNPKVVFK